MMKENTDERSVEERFNKRTLHHKQTLVRKVPFPAGPPFTRIIEGPCEALPDGDDLQ